MTDRSPVVKGNALHQLGIFFQRRRLTRYFFREFGRSPSLDTPSTFNERVLHRLLHDRDRRLNILSDKIAVKDFVADRVGARYVVPLLGKWKRARDIDWQSLPDRFVLKPNQASGPFALVHGAAQKDVKQLARLAKRWFLRHPLQYFRGEWGYRDVPRFLMAEPLLAGPEGGPATEINVFTFRGKARLIRLFRGRKKRPERRDAWFDPTGRQVEISVNGIRGIRMALADSVRTEAMEVAEKLAESFDQLRVDFFLTDQGLQVGELTAYSWGGFAAWSPDELDAKVGTMWSAQPDYSIFEDFRDPDLAEVRPGDPVTWLAIWEGLINAQAYEPARRLFAPDVVAFGSYAETLSGLDALERLQWRKIWGTTRNFAFETPVIRSASEESYTVAVRWRSEGRTEAGGWYERRGRATLLLERQADGDIVCTHSHFSMDPGIPARRAA